MKKAPILLAAVLAATSARAVQPPPQALDRVLPAHASRLVVKFRSTVTACVHCLLAQGIPFATVTGRDSLDRLNRAFGVRDARPLFLQEHALDADRRAAYQQKIDGVRARFPARAARIPSGATVPDLSNVYVLDLPRGTDLARGHADPRPPAPRPSDPEERHDVVRAVEVTISVTGSSTTSRSSPSASWPIPERADPSTIPRSAAIPSR